MRATELVFVLAIGSTIVITLPAAVEAQTLEWDGAGATVNGTVEGGGGHLEGHDRKLDKRWRHRERSMGR
ncbi:hypothetical protein ACJ5NV_14695 [Loktanella agnita]